MAAGSFMIHRLLTTSRPSNDRGKHDLDQTAPAALIEVRGLLVSLGGSSRASDAVRLWQLDGDGWWLARWPLGWVGRAASTPWQPARCSIVAGPSRFWRTLPRGGAVEWPP